MSGVLLPHLKFWLNAWTSTKTLEDIKRRLLHKTIMRPKRVFLEVRIHTLYPKGQALNPSHILIRAGTTEDTVLENMNLASLITESHAFSANQRDTLNEIARKW